VLYVGYDHIGVRECLLEYFWPDVQRRLKACMDTVTPALAQQFNGKSPLDQGLAAGNGYAPTGFLVEVNIGHDGFHETVYRELFTPDDKRVGGAGIGAFQAARARFPVYAGDGIVLIDERAIGCNGTRLKTISALVGPDAPGGVDPDLVIGMDALRIAAPPAAQGTSFQKDLCPDAGTVMDRVPLYVEDAAFRLVYYRRNAGCILDMAHCNAFLGLDGCSTQYRYVLKILIINDFSAPAYNRLRRPLEMKWPMSCK